MTTRLAPGRTEGGLVEDPVLRHRLRFRRTMDADGGEALLVDIQIEPGGGVTPHVHPAMEERFTVMAGRPEFLEGRRWRTASPGETVVVPAGVRHTYRHRHDATAHVECHARPPSSLQEFLEAAAALSRAGAISRHALPRRPSVLLDAAVLAYRHRETVVLGFPPLPPAPVQRLLLHPLGRRLDARRRSRPEAA